MRTRTIRSRMVFGHLVGDHISDASCPLNNSHTFQTWQKCFLVDSVENKTTLCIFASPTIPLNLGDCFLCGPIPNLHEMVLNLTDFKTRWDIPLYSQSHWNSSFIFSRSPRRSRPAARVAVAVAFGATARTSTSGNGQGGRASQRRGNA